MPLQMVCETELGAEYLGGVLASSRTEIPRDDRAASLIALIGRLSTYQLRTHYIMYALAQRAISGEEINLGLSRERTSHARFFLPRDDWIGSMDFSRSERFDWQQIRSHVLTGLLREALIEQEHAFGDPGFLKEFVDSEAAFPDPGFVFTVASLGIELFTAAHGAPGGSQGAFLQSSDHFKIDDPIELGTGFCRVSDLRRSAPSPQSAP